MKKLISLVLVLCLVASVLVMPAAATTADEKPDGLDSSTFNDAYDYVYSNGIYEADEIPEGTDPNEFMKEATTRGEYALVLARFHGVDVANYTPAGTEYFTDMDDCASELVAKAIMWGKDNYCINGYKDGSYKPNKEITREEICALIGRYFLGQEVVVDAATGATEHKPGPGADKVADLVPTDNLPVFTDSEELSQSYGLQYIEFCVQYGLIQGHADGSFGAGESTERAQLAAIVHRAETDETKVAAPAAPLTTTKFYLAVESGEGFVSARVNNSYIMEVKVADAVVNPKQVTLKAEMSNVASLGVSGTRKHETTITTNIESDGSADLGVWLNECFAFEGCTIDIRIGEKTCQYIVGASTVTDGVASIIFMPANVEDTRAAWQELTSHVSTSTQEADDSKIIIANGSYLQLGTEKLEFENAGVGDLTLDNFSNMDALETEIRSKVKLSETGESAVAARLEAGTTLAVGSSVATLDDSAVLTVEGVETTKVEGLLGDLRDAESTYAMAKALVETVNMLVGTVDGETVSVAIDFE